jgi:cation-transporting ATPase E
VTEPSTPLPFSPSEANDQPAPDQPAVVPAGSVVDGLTAAEVAQRRAEGRTNAVPDETTRSVSEIIKANVFTRFNAILGSLLVVILLVQEYRDALFGIVLVTNALIGILQELKAKQTLDKLAVLSEPRARVVRDGVTSEVPDDEVVLDDVIALAPGDQITVDGVVLDTQGLNVDESLLTGESDPIAKLPGDQVRSGSFVVVGSGFMQATGVGQDAYAYKLSSQAREFRLVDSELRNGIDKLLRVIQWLMIPTGILLVWSQFESGESITEAVQGSVAGLGAMVPEGLVLLTSVAFALGVIRLGRRKVLTQELAAIEGLARVDVVCLDKTGTITEATLEVVSVEPLGEHTAVGLGAMASSDPNPNPSLHAIRDAFPPPGGWDADAVVPFSSARKWSAASFGEHGAWFLGAPDILLDQADDPDAIRTTVEAQATEGRRVLLLAAAPSGLDEETLPSRLDPAALVMLEERIRPDALQTIEYFTEQGVSVKVISGDHPATVGAVAGRVGVPGADNPVDARTLPEDEDQLAEILEEHSVFGRVTPHQKRAMVGALHSRKHTVAMTGDGVNDVLALKDADIGVAMGSGSAATRSVARFVFLDNSFASFPAVVAEGRRVIANVERVANLFITKSIYAFLLSLTVGVLQLPFPFFPRHLTIVSSLTIGIPAFFLALAPNARRYRPGFLGRVLRFAIPAGTVAAAASFAAYGLARQELSLEEARTAGTIVLFMVALWVLTILARPFNVWRQLLVAAMAFLFVLALTIPAARDYFALDLPSPLLFLACIGIGAIACGFLELGWRFAGWVDRTPGLPTLGIVVDDEP